jgi:hypothetical protein
MTLVTLTREIHVQGGEARLNDKPLPRCVSAFIGYHLPHTDTWHIHQLVDGAYISQNGTRCALQYDKDRIMNPPAIVRIQRGLIASTQEVGS